ncbi:MFS transporter [Rhodotorula paludigena]|uniref:MFS transporter n=1 Tax=Rhodotorula paludigena TaxID=86838 RepID=UPI0031800F46
MATVLEPGATEPRPEPDSPATTHVDAPPAPAQPVGKPPFLLRLRSSTAFISLTVGFGLLVDTSALSLPVPVIPFHLEDLGYSDVEGKTGWLIAAFAAGLIVSSPPCAWLGARFKNRQWPLLGGLACMAGAQILFMEVDNYAAMVVARVLQGCSGTVLWTIGLALISDSVPEERIGTVLGRVMAGFSIGQALGPPVGGSLYRRFGFRAPFIFSLILIGVDLTMRLLIIEKHVALRWIDKGHSIPYFEARGYVSKKAQEDQPIPPSPDIPLDELSRTQSKPVSATEAEPPRPLVTGFAARLPRQYQAIWALLVDPRSLVALTLSGLQGFIFGGLLDTSMTLRLEEAYGLDSMGAGLVFLAAVVPAFIGSPLSGWGTDRYGPKWITALGVLLSIPAYPLLIIHGPLALFIVFLALVGFSLSLAVTPITVDLDIVSSKAGMPTAALFGVWNMSFSIGALIGPIIAGQLNRALSVDRGWIIMAALSSALSAVFVPLTAWYVGGRPDWGWVRRMQTGRRE